MVTKNQYLEESIYVLGEWNGLTQLIRPTRKMLKEKATEEGIIIDIEERVALKRALRARKVEFDVNAPTHELVQLAILKKINFDKLLTDD